MTLSLIFPAYNEAESITDVLERWSGYCVANHVDYEIIVVNDGSGDGTGAKVKNFAATHPAVQLVEHAANQGYGAALRSGFSAASGDFIFFTDSDGQFGPDDLDRTLPLLGVNTIILGYREHRAEGLIRQLNAWGWGQCVGLALGVRVRDLNCAWKLFPRTLLTDLTLISVGAFINAELLYHARKKKMMFREIPVHHFTRQSGSPTGANPGVIYRAFRELMYFLGRHR